MGHSVYARSQWGMALHYNTVSHHYSDVIVGVTAPQINSLTIVYSTVYSGTDQRKHQSSASLAFVRGIHRWPVSSLHKWPAMQKMFPYDDVIMIAYAQWSLDHDESCLCCTWVSKLHWMITQIHRFNNLISAKIVTIGLLATFYHNTYGRFWKL